MASKTITYLMFCFFRGFFLRIFLRIFLDEFFCRGVFFYRSFFLEEFFLEEFFLEESGDYPSRGGPSRGTSRPAGLHGTPLIGVTPRPAGTYEAESPQIGDDSLLPSPSLTPPFSSVVIPPSLALVLAGPLRLSPTSRCQTHTDVGDNRLQCNTLLLLYNIGNKGHI